MNARQEVSASEALDAENHSQAQQDKRRSICSKRTRLVPLAIASMVLLSVLQFITPPSSIIHTKSATRSGVLPDKASMAISATKINRQKNRIDLKSCPSSRPMLVGEYDWSTGFGHRMTQMCSVLHFAILNGYCMCITDEWPSPVINELLLSSIFQTCPVNATVHACSKTETMKKLMHQQNDTRTIFRKSAPNLWDVPMAERGYGGLLAFVDGFFRDNHIPEDTVYPTYLAARERFGRDGAFLNESHDDNIIAGVVHIRVGDIALEKEQSYWENLFQAFNAICNFERGPDTRLHLYFAYNKVDHRFDELEEEEKVLLKEYGQWSKPSDKNLLPESHAFIADICDKYHKINCFWKRGTSLEESIDMFVSADLIYVSGSSYSQTLSLFNAKNAIKVVAVTKEFGFGGLTADQVPFLSTHTTAYSSLGYYYINAEGALYSEQLAYLNLDLPTKEGAQNEVSNETKEHGSSSVVNSTIEVSNAVAADSESTENDYSRFDKMNNTVVTAYFQVPSKHTSGQYLDWMSNMLSLQDAMVIFASPNMTSQILKFRAHALNRTVIIPMEIDEVPMAKSYPTEFWQQELDLDKEKNIHKSYQVFWVWLTKSWFVSEAIKRNPFDSYIFVWSDIGCFRKTNYNNKEMVLHPEVIPRQAIIQMAHRPPNPPDTVWWNDKHGQAQHFYHSGSMMAGYRDTWEQFHNRFMETVEGFIERNMFIGEDQAVLQSTCLQHPHLCEYIPHGQVKDDFYFGLRYALHYGGNYKTWSPPPFQNDVSIKTEEPTFTIKPMKQVSSPCRNSDFQPVNSVAVVTFLTNDSPDYIRGIRALAKSVRQNVQESVDLVIVRRSETQVSSDQMDSIRKQTNVTTICVVDPIEPAKQPAPQFKDQFTKLHIFGLTSYDQLVYMDADTLVLGPIDELFLTDYGKLGATRDIENGRWLDTFNMGVAVVRPNATEYQRLLNLQHNGTVVYRYAMAEQGWLNVVYKNQWKDFGLKYNVNKACVLQRACTAEELQDARIFHFTLRKPWVHCQSAGQDKFCKIWNELASDESDKNVIDDDQNDDAISTSSVCTNGDFHPKAKVSIWTMITPDDLAYVRAAMVLVDSVKRHSTVEHDRVVIELVDKPLGDETWEKLKKAGWTHRCQVKSIVAPVHIDFRRYIDQFTKLRIFGAIEYERVVYLDSDTFVVGNIDAMLTNGDLLNETGKRIGATRDFYGEEFRDWFNAGVLVLHPKQAEYERLMKLIADKSVSFTGSAEQGWLGKVYENSWQEIGLVYNANMAVYKRDCQQSWDKHADDIRVIHYTLHKPWDCNVDLCDAWKEAAKQVLGS